MRTLGVFQPQYEVTSVVSLPGTKRGVTFSRSSAGKPPFWRDNASSHKTPKVKRWLEQHPRFVLHFTPTSSSWINLVERWFSELTTKLLKRGQHRSVRALNNDIRNWIEDWNENPRP